eukprot:936862_1
MAQGNKKATGTCKRFNSAKGFGFITCDDGSGDVFVHQTEIYADGFRSLQEGESLEFDIEEQDDGRRKATNVTGPNGAFVKGDNNRGGGGGGVICCIRVVVDRVVVVVAADFDGGQLT